MKKQQGFTLIELMIVVAIIGVLSAFAIPAYQKYVAKSEAATGVATLRALLTNFDMYEQDNTAGVTSLDQIGTTETAAGTLGKIELQQSGATAATGLKFTFNNAALSGAVVTFTKSASGWTCSTANIDADYKPKGC
ncbi:pilin [Photobacterium leiognathi]|uniref:pilin n=1 Tax=Photobacterium leiognathi TaxID=553611 RepID=UPI002980BD96|nr:pilin [Photobacterium leiognathi]